MGRTENDQGVDNEIFRETYRSINEHYCPYEKSLLTNNCQCSQAERFCIAEREGVSCRLAAAQHRCLQLLEILRAQARFALRTATLGAALPHARAMRVQVGGLRGLHRVLAPDGPIPHPIPDVHALVDAAQTQYGNLEALPFAPIIQQIAAYRGRQPFRERRRR